MSLELKFQENLSRTIVKEILKLWFGNATFIREEQKSFSLILRDSPWSAMSDSEGETYEKQVKIVLIGDGSSGKVKIIEKLLGKFSVGLISVRLQSPNVFPKIRSIEITIKLWASIII